MENIKENPVKPIFNPPPLLWACVSLGVTLYGILFKQWNLQPIVFLFWIEVILAIAAMLVRVIFAFGGRPYFELIGNRLFTLFGAGFLGIAFIMLTVTFTFKAFDGGFSEKGFSGIRFQVYILAGNALMALIFHYFLNGKYRESRPMEEAASTFVYLLVMLCLLMAVTMHLIPAYPQLNQSLWTGLAVVLIKFIVDIAAKRVRGVSAQ
jgi:Family of unknown function (DUF6498)